MSEEREAMRKALEEKWDREADLREQRAAERHEFDRRNTEAHERDVNNRVQWRFESTMQQERQVAALESIAKTFSRLVDEMVAERDRA